MIHRNQFISQIIGYTKYFRLCDLFTILSDYLLLLNLLLLALDGLAGTVELSQLSLVRINFGIIGDILLLAFSSAVQVYRKLLGLIFPKYSPEYWPNSTDLADCLTELSVSTFEIGGKIGAADWAGIFEGRKYFLISGKPFSIFFSFGFLFLICFGVILGCCLLFLSEQI